MESIREQFVSFDVAKQLRDKGFPQQDPYHFLDDETDILCREGYTEDGIDILSWNTDDGDIARPSLYLVNMWLFKTYHLFVNAYPGVHMTDNRTVVYSDFTMNVVFADHIDNPHDYEVYTNLTRKLSGIYYSSYEDAMNAGFQECMKLIPTKGKSFLRFPFFMQYIFTIFAA